MRKPRLEILGGAFVADDATVVGDVTLGEGVSVLYGTVVRGDVAPITIGARTNVQDASVIHPMTGTPVEVGEDVTVGHRAVVHCASVGDGCLVGIGAILLTGARLGAGCIVAAGSVVVEGAEVPERSLVMGVPARVVREDVLASAPGARYEEWFHRAAGMAPSCDAWIEDVAAVSPSGR